MLSTPSTPASTSSRTFKRRSDRTPASDQPTDAADVHRRFLAVHTYAWFIHTAPHRTRCEFTGLTLFLRTGVGCDDGHVAVAFTSHPFASPPVVTRPVTDRPASGDRPSTGRSGSSGIFGRRTAAKRSAATRRRHGANVPFDRDELERSGWRTTLDYHENHVRRRDGRLDQLEAVWRATAERTGPDGNVCVVTATAHTPADAWTRLRHEADLANCGANRGADGASRGSPTGRSSRRREHASR